MKSLCLLSFSFVLLLFAACRKDPKLNSANIKPEPVVLSFDARVMGKVCGLPWIEVIRNADSLANSGIIPTAHKSSKYYQVVNLPDTFWAVGRTFTMDVREATPEESFRVCNLRDPSFPDLAIVKIEPID